MKSLLMSQTSGTPLVSGNSCHWVPSTVLLLVKWT